MKDKQTLDAERSAFMCKCRFRTPEGVCTNEKVRCHHVKHWSEELPCNVRYLCDRMKRYDKKVKQQQLEELAELPVGTVVWYLEWGEIPERTEVRGYEYNKYRNEVEYLLKGRMYGLKREYLYATKEEAILVVAKKKAMEAAQYIAYHKDDLAKLGVGSMAQLLGMAEGSQKQLSENNTNTTDR